MPGPLTIMRSRPLPASPTSDPPKSGVTIVRSRPLPADATITGDAIRPPDPGAAPVRLPDVPVAPGPGPLSGLLVPGRRPEGPSASNLGAGEPSVAGWKRTPLQGAAELVEPVLNNRPKSLADLARQTAGELPPTDYYTEVIAKAPPGTKATDIATNAAKAGLSGLMGATMSQPWSAVEMSLDALGLREASAWAARVREESQSQRNDLRAGQIGAGPTERAFYGGIESIGAMIPSIVATILTKNPSVGLGMMGVGTGAEKYTELKKTAPHLTPLGRFLAGVVEGSAEVLTEKIPLDRLVGDLVEGSGIWQTIRAQVMSEVPGEQVATFTQDANEWAAVNPGKPVADFLAERPARGYETLVSTIVATVGMSAGSIALDRGLQKATSADVVREGVGGDAARRVTDEAAASILTGAIADLQDQNRREPPAASTSAATAPTPPTTPPVGSASIEAPGTSVAAGPSLADLGRSPAAPYLPPEFTAVGEEPVAEPQSAEDDFAQRQDDLVNRILAKNAAGQPLGSPELRAAFEQRQALDAARADAAEPSIADEGDEDATIRAPRRLSAPPEQPEPGVRYEMDASDIDADPAALQYRGVVNAEGVEAERKITTPYDPKKGGVLTVWKNPATGKTLVVNGHHRLSAAKRDGATVAVIFSRAATAKDARAEGALLNLQEDSTSLADAVQFMVDTDMRTPEALEAAGIGPRAKVSRQAAAIAALDPHIRQQWKEGALPDDIAAAIGAARLTVEQQEAAADFYRGQESRGRTVTASVMTRAMDRIKDAPTVEEDDGGQPDIFGTKKTKNVFADRMDLETFILRELGKDKSRLRAAIRERDRLARANTVVDVETAESLAAESARAQATLDRLMRSKGPISDILNAAAAELSEGGDREAIRARVLRDVTAAAEAEFGTGTSRRRDGTSSRPAAVPERPVAEGDAPAATGPAPRPVAKRKGPPRSKRDKPFAEMTAAEKAAAIQARVDAEDRGDDAGPPPSAPAAPTPTDSDAAARAANADRRAAALKKISAKLSQLNTGVDPEMVTLMVEVLETYIADGILDAKKAWRQLRMDLGDQADKLKRHFEVGWEMMRGERVTIDEATDKIARDLAERKRRLNWTRDEAAVFLNDHADAFDAAGLSPMVVGGVATKGGARKDLDIVMRPNEPMTLEQAIQVFEDTVLPELSEQRPGVPGYGPHESVDEPGWFVNVKTKDGRFIDVYFPSSDFPMAEDEADAPKNQTAVEPAKPAKDRIRELLQEAEPLAKKGDLTAAERDRYEAIMAQVHDLKFEADPARGDVAKVAAADKRKSTLSPAAVVAAYNDKRADRAIYRAISKAADGVSFGATTAVDDIMDGKNADVSPEAFYTAFAATRAQLRADHGDTITLYRAVGKQRTKATTNWATTREFAAQFGSDVISQAVPVDRILAVNVNATGTYHELIVGDPPATAKPEKANPWEGVPPPVRSRVEAAIAYVDDVLERATYLIKHEGPVGAQALLRTEQDRLQQRADILTKFVGLSREKGMDVPSSVASALKRVTGAMQFDPERGVLTPEQYNAFGRRAKAGGEEGPDGKWYEGGQWMNVSGKPSERERASAPKPATDARGSNPVGFGKYATLTLDELFEQQPGYVDWLLGQANPSRSSREAIDYLRSRRKAEPKPDAPPETPDAPITDEDRKAIAQMGITVTEEGDRVLLGGKTYDVKDLIKETASPHGGAKFDGLKKAWSVTRKAFAALAEKIRSMGVGKGQSIAKYLMDPTLRAVRDRADAIPDESAIADPESYFMGGVGPSTGDLIRRGTKFGVPEHVVTEQVEDVARILRAFDQKKPLYLLASDPGSGKTFVLGGAMRELQRRGAKRIVYVTLRTELIAQIRKDLADYGVADVEIVTYPSMREGDVKDTDVLIFDEAHSVKNEESQQGAAAARWINRAGFTIFASATPFENPSEAAYLAPTGVFDSLGGFDQFAQAFGARRKEIPLPYGGTKVVYDWRRTTTSDVDGKAARDWLNKQGMMSTRRLVLPEGQVDSRMAKVTASEADVRRYETLARLAQAHKKSLPGLSKDWVTNFSKRLLEASKVDAAIKEAEAARARGRFPIIFVETKAERTLNIPEILDREREYQQARAMAKAMKDQPPSRKEMGAMPEGIAYLLSDYMRETGEEVITIPSAEDKVAQYFGADQVAIFTGSAGDKAQANLDAWRAGSKPILVATMAKGGTGLSLHDTKGDHQTTQINLNLPWTATQVVQVTQRSARYGLKGQAEIVWMFSDNIDFDQKLAKKVGGRMADMGAVVHGERLKGSQEIEEWTFTDGLFSDDDEDAPSPDQAQSQTPDESGLPKSGAPVAFTTENLQTIFGLSDEQTAGVFALAEAMGLDLSKIKITLGGEPGSGALPQRRPVLARLEDAIGADGINELLANSPWDAAEYRYGRIISARSISDNTRGFGPRSTKGRELSGETFAKWLQSDDALSGIPESETDYRGLVSRAREAAADALFQDPTRDENFRRWFGASKVVDNQGKPLVVYHGARRMDRVGTRFLKSRATSGPMSFFTDSRDLASSYAESKSDTSLEAPDDYAGWFQFKPKGSRSSVDIARAWYFLTLEQRAEIEEKLPHVTNQDADGNELAGFRLDPGEYGLAGKEHWDFTIRQKRGNVLAAAVDIWLSSAGLFNDERAFLDILTIGGMPMESVTFDSPHADRAGVIPVYLSIKNPLDTSAIPPAVLEALERRSRRQGPPRGAESSGDLWDKRNRHPREWISQLKTDVADGANSHAWTSIPDWVTATLKELGYDGIRDRSGKNSGYEHAVWIPFEPTQIKSAIGNRGTFDPNSPNILLQSDLFDTGEEQPRLPGDVGDVREVENPTPQEELPAGREFGLTPPQQKARKAQQTALFDDLQPEKPKGGLRAVDGRQAVLFQDNTPTAWYYSNVLDALKTWQSKGTTDQLLAHLKKTKGAMDEAKDIGLDAWLADRTSVTRDEVRAFVEANRIEIEEVVLSGARGKADERERMDVIRNKLAGYGFDIWTDEGEAGAPYLVRRSDGESIDPDTDIKHEPDAIGGLDAHAIRRLWREYQELEIGVAALPGPEYAAYQLGGPSEDYREILLKLPNQKRRAGDAFSRRFQEISRKYGNLTGPALTAAWTADESEELTQLARAADAAPEYRAPHFNERGDNLLAHVRANDRVLADGRRVLFIEEIQSDWHQQGRKYGYAIPRDRYVVAVKDTGERLGYYDTREEAEAWIARNPRPARFEVGTIPDVPPDAVPDAPFKGDGWKKLALKRMLAYAAEGGYDGIAWTTGSAQAERYDLSKQIDSLRYYKDDAGRFVVGAHKNGERVLSLVEDEKTLPDKVGKDIAEKIIATADDQSRELSGVDLKVGGEGMRGFYDRELVNLANDLAKRYGQRVEQGTIPGVERVGSAGAADAEYPSSYDIHVLATPAEMRETIRKHRLPLFQAAWHGSPHIFDQFSLQKIGTGEGAQAYGWGLYFAGDKAVAEYYRKALTARQSPGRMPTLTIDGFRFDYGRPDLTSADMNGAYALVKLVGNLSSAAGWRAKIRAALDLDIQRHPGTSYARDAHAALALLDRFGDRLSVHIPERMGRLYKVEIPEDDDFLDYDKPLSQQPEKVQAAIRRIGLRTDDGLWYAHQLTAADVASGNFATGQVGDWVARVDDSAGNLIGWGGWTWGTEAGAAENAKSRNGIGKASDPRGSTLYNRIPGDTAREKSERLAAEGVAGIRFLDGSNRAKGDIWEIVRKDGYVLREVSNKAAAEEELLEQQRKYGKGITLREKKGRHNYVVFDDKLVQIMDFDQGAKASVEFMEGGEALIRALQNPDVSSPTHELAHIARRWLLNRDVPAEHRRGISDEDIATAEQWAGAKDGVWDRDAEEKFARGFERYLRDGGPALPSKIRAIFQKFAEWLSDIYRSLQGSAIDVEITPAMRQVFDRLVTRAERNASHAGKYKPGNPFADKAIRARERADRLNQPTEREKAMASAFPLGAGFGRPGDAKRADRSIDRAMEAVEAEKTAREWEAKAEAFDRGEINAQGRRWDADKQARSDKRASAQEKREARIAAAKAAREGKERWEVRAEVYADSTGSLAGSARNLVLSDHRGYVEQALADGKPVPADVLADYPDLVTRNAQPPRSAPSGTATVASEGVADLPVRTGRVPRIGRTLFAEPAPLAPTGSRAIDQIRAVELPELVELAEQLIATPQVVKRFRKEGKTGDFTPGGPKAGRIRIHADLFAPGKARELAQTLAHEIGHLIDWLPDQTLKRGNILGRLQSVTEFLQHTFTSQGGQTIHRDDVRKELIAVSKAWRGDFNEKGTESYDRYRASGKELYADALSALLNNPGWLESKAPIFYEQFFDHLDQKPEVKDAYFGLQELLSGTREELVARREARVDAMFGRADAKALDVQRLKVAERQQADTHYWARFRQQHIDRNAPLLDRIKALEKKGVRIPQDEDPRYFLEERNYLGGKQKAFLERYIQPIYQSVQDAGIAWDEFGKALFYERIMADPKRSQIANPLGLSPDSSTELYATLQKRLSAEQLKVLERAVIAFRLAAREVAEDAYDAGLYRDEMYEEMKENPAYVAFRVIDYMEKDMTSAVHQQIGTVKGIQNPADATILKMLVTMRAAEHNRVKVAAFDFLHKHFPGDITQAPGQWNGHGIVPRPPDDPKRQVLVPYKEKGRTKGKYVDPYVAASLNNESVGQNNAVVAALRWVNSKVFRPAFTGLNLGFQTFNFSRDFWRFWKNTPTMTLGRAMQRYKQGYRMAKVRAYGVKENASAADRAAYRDLIDAEGASILSLTFNDMMDGRDVADSQAEETFAQHGLGGPPSSQNRLRKVIEWVKNTGDFIETLPKAAAIYEFKGEGAISDISHADRSFIRRKVGSPDFLMRGTYHPITNEVFLFSNAILQAWRADFEVATDPKTASGFWWKTAAVNIAPKLAIAALLASSLGDDDDDDEWVKWLRRSLENISEYDLTNYLPIPVPGYSDDQGNTLYVRLPQDDSGRLIGGLAWKALKIARDIGDQETWKTVGQVFDYMAGQAPGVTPSIQAASDVVQFASGRNVYDPFRNRFLFTEDEVKAGGWDAATKFIGYEFQQLGGSIFVKFHAGDERPEVKTPGQQLLEFPLLSAVAGRWFKISQQGQRERLRAAQAVAATDSARLRRAERSAVNDAIRTYREMPGPLRTPAASQRLAVELAKTLYPDAPARERQAHARDLDKKIRMGAARGQGDPLTDAVLGATSTAERVAIINDYFASKPAGREAWVRQALNRKVLSPEAARAVLRSSRKEE